MADGPVVRPPCPSCGYLADPAAGALNFCPRCGASLRAADRSGTASLLNTVVADRYRLLQLLGEGGMGAVYKAEHIRMGKALALKLLRGAFAREPGAVARFRAEAQIVSRLSHPHTIAVFDFGEMGVDPADGFYLAMEYVPGMDLAAVLRAEGRLSEARAADIVQQMLGSLAEAHDAGIVHRDVKPGNVMLQRTRSGEDFAKVLDFGIAKLRDEGVSATTSSGAIIGTPSYLSPEQARGELIDARSDLYSVGALLYELVAGRPPFAGMSPIATVSAHLHDEPAPLAEVAPGVSPGLAEVVHRALRKRPADRFGSADEMRGALLRLAAAPVAGGGGTPRSVPSITGEMRIARREDFAEFEREVSRLRRSRILPPVALALLVLLGGLTVWRWADVWSLLRARAPAVARLLPASLRPADVYDGEEHEPNDSPALANPLPLPPGRDGLPGGGVAVVRGHIGAKLSDTSGDVDVFRIEVPPGTGRRVLVADWEGEKAGEGIRGLDVTLTLNRERGAGSERTSAPLVATADRGGPGEPERLAAEVAPGTYFLAVREKHRDDTGPVEKPTDWYVLSVRLAAPEPGVEVEPNDAPEEVELRALRYPEWRAVAARNPVGEGRPLRGDIWGSDADVLGVGPTAPGEAPAWLAAVPDAGFALSVELWRPDAVDLDPPPNADRIRFGPPLRGERGAPVLVDLGGVPRPDAPALVRLRSAGGDGRWTVLALGDGAASGDAVVALVRGLAAAGRPGTALELAAGIVRAMPAAPWRGALLHVAGQIAAAAAPAPR